MGPSPAELRVIKADILKAMEFVFNDTLKGSLSPTEWRIYAGISYFLENAVPAFKDDRAQKLGLTTKYVLEYSIDEVRAVPTGSRFEFLLPNSLMDQKRHNLTALGYIQRKADLVWDDREELIDCNFSGMYNDNYLAILDLS